MTSGSSRRLTSEASCERSGGLAVDLPGFGRSGKPGYLRYTIDEYDRFIERFLDELEVERVQLVVHDWGAVGLAFAQRLPERVERLVIINAVPLLPGYRWHRMARVWRTPGLGELAMGTTDRFTLRAALAGVQRDAGTDAGGVAATACSSTSTRAPSARSCACTAAPHRRCWRRRARAWERSRCRRWWCGACATPTSPPASAREYAQALPHAELRRAPRRGALAVARPPGRDRARGGVPERRVSARRSRDRASAMTAPGAGAPARIGQTSGRRGCRRRGRSRRCSPSCT